MRAFRTRTICASSLPLTLSQPGAASGLVSLDSAPAQSVNCSRPASAAQVVATTIAVPDAGQHTLTVAWDPKSAKGSHLDVDAFRLTGSAPKVVGASSKPPANVNVDAGASGSSGVLVDQTSPLISACSSWTRSRIAAKAHRTGRWRLLRLTCADAPAYTGEWAAAGDSGSLGGSVAFAASAGARASFKAPVGATSIAWMARPRSSSRLTV